MPNSKVNYLVLIVHSPILKTAYGEDKVITEIDGFCPVYNDEQKAKEHANEYNTTYIAIQEKEIEK